MRFGIPNLLEFLNPEIPKITKAFTYEFGDPVLLENV